MTEQERLWRWFARIHHLKTGAIPDRNSQFRQELFEWWLSGYKCRQLDEESERCKEGVLK